MQKPFTLEEQGGPKPLFSGGGEKRRTLSTNKDGKTHLTCKMFALFHRPNVSP
jgi:hypothetical protein